MNHPDPAFEAALEAYHQACLSVLDLLQEESDALQAARLEALPGFADRRRVLLGRLESTQKATRTAAPATIPEFLKPRIQATADLIQRAVKLDRQNEQWWLRHRLVPPEMIPNSASRNPRRVRSTYGFAGGATSP